MWRIRSLHTELGAPTDIAAVPDQPPVQPRIRFPATLMGSKQQSFSINSTVGLSTHVREMQHTAICRYFTAESGKHSKDGFRHWKHALGKDGIISCHGHGLSHKQAMVAWQENKAHKASNADRLDAARVQQVIKNRQEASRERSSSALKRIKTNLRSTMHEERLVNLAVLLSVEQDFAYS